MEVRRISFGSTGDMFSKEAEYLRYSASSGSSSAPAFAMESTRKVAAIADGFIFTPQSKGRIEGQNDRTRQASPRNCLLRSTLRFDLCPVGGEPGFQRGTIRGFVFGKPLKLYGKLQL